MKGYQPKKSNVKQTPPNEGSSVTPPSNINSENGQNTMATSKSTTGQINSESVTINPPISYGWVCPKCGRVNAPWKDHCDCDGGSGPIWKFDYDHPNYKWYYELPKGPTKPYEWGDTPGWWNQGPTCEEKFWERATPCANPTAEDPNFGRSTAISTETSTLTGGDPNIKIYN